MRCYFFSTSKRVGRSTTSCQILSHKDQNIKISWGVDKPPGIQAQQSSVASSADQTLRGLVN